MKKLQILLLVLLLAIQGVSVAQVAANDTVYEYYDEPVKSVSPNYEYQVFTKNDNGQVIIGVQKLSQKIAYKEANGLYAIAIVVYDTVIDSYNGKPEKVTAKDYIVHMNEESYKKFTQVTGPCYVHAKWTIKKNGYYYGTTEPDNPDKPGKKILLVYSFGEILTVVNKKEKAEPVIVRKRREIVADTSTSKKNTDCPDTLDCERLGKKLNPKTCRCEKKE